MVLTKDKSVLYTCTVPGLYTVSKFVKDPSGLVWKKDYDLPRSDKDDSEAMLQLRLDKHDKVLFGNYYSLVIETKLLR